MQLIKMNWINIESKYQNERYLQLLSRLKSMGTGGKDHTEDWVLEKATFYFTSGVIF